MSYSYRTRIQQLLDEMKIKDMTKEEIENPSAWCGISDEVVRGLLENGETIDEAVDKMSEVDLLAVHQEVMRRFRKRLKAAKEKISGKVEADPEEAEVTVEQEVA